MEDKHNVILILLSSSGFISSFRRLFILSHSRFKVFSSFLFRSSKPSRLSRREAPSKSSQGFNLILCILQFYLIILLLAEFFTVVEGSCWRSSSIFSSSCLEVQLILRILLKWSFAFLRSSQLSNHFRLWPVITFWSWDVTYKTTTSLFFSLLIFSTTPFKPSF